MSETTNPKGTMEKQATRNLLGWVQAGLSIVLCIVTVGLVPWARGVNAELAEARTFRTKMEAWAAEGPRITPDKLRTWKLETQDEMRKEFGAQLASMTLALQRIELELAKHTSATMKQP